MGMKSKKNVKPNTPGKKNIKNIKKVGQVKQNALLKKRLKSVLGPTASNDNKIKIKTDNASKAMNSSLISSAINDKKFILRIEESESDEYFKKKPRNVQESKQSSDQDDKPKVNGVAAVDMSSTGVTQPSKKKNKKMKNKSKQEKNESIVEENKESIIKSQNKIKDENETVPKDCRGQPKPATQDNQYTVKQKLPKSKKLKKDALKEFTTKNVVTTIETDKGNKEKLTNNNENEAPEISQDECSVPERKKPCKKSKQTKLEKEKTNKATGKKNKNKKEKNVVSSLKAKEKDGTSDSDRSSYIQQFFEDSAVDSRDEQMDESESIYEDESEYDDYMSDSETDKGKSEDDGGTNVEPKQKQIQKANEISDHKVVNHGKSKKKKITSTARKDSNNSPEKTAKAKGGDSNTVSVAGNFAEESVDDEEGAGSGDDEEGDESDNGEGEESNDSEKGGESDDDKESKESGDDEEGEDSDNHEKYEKSADNDKKMKSKKKKKARKTAKTKGGDVNMISVAEFSGEESVGDGAGEESDAGDDSEESDDHEEDEKSFDDKRRKLMKKKKAGIVSREWNNSPEQIKRKDRSPNMVSVSEFLGEESVDDEEGEDEEDSEESGDEEKGDSGDNEEGDESDDEEDDQSVDDGDDEEDISRFDRRLLKNWKNINFFCNNYCSEDENDRDNFFQKQPSKKKRVQTYGAKVEEDESEDSDNCFTDDYGSDQSAETDEEEYDSFSGEEGSSYSDEYDEEEEATSYSEATDEDGSYSYDFEEESHDEDYELPEGEVEDVIVRPGKARIYDMNEHNVSFDSDSPQIIDLGNKAESESSLSTALVPMRRSQVKDDPKIEVKDDPESDDSCPQLVPINYDLAPSDCYDYEFSDDDGDDFSEDDDSQEYDSGDSESEQQGQEENTASEISECKLITYDGEKTVAYNLGGVEQNASFKQKEEPSKEMKEKEEEKIKVNKKSKKRKASETLLNEDEQKDSPKKIESKKRKNNEKNYEGKPLLHPEDIQYIKLDHEVDDSRLNDMEVVEEATLTDSQFETKEAHSSLQNQSSEAKDYKNSEELKIQKPQGWQIEVNLKTKSLFYNSFHSRYVLILLKDYLYFNGALKIKLLLGSAEVFGYVLQKDEEVQSYSIHGGALLDLSPRTSEKAVTEDEIDNQLSLYSQDLLSSDVAQIKKEFDRRRDALILLSRNDNTKKIEMVRRYMRENLFPTMTGLDVGSSSYISQFILHSVFHNFNRSKCITFNNQWLDIKLNSNTKLAIIGGKSVGKSTLLRYTINRHLTKFKKILLIDLDIGQQEVFVPQTVTATVIEKPILGPGYLFTNPPTKSFLFGHINVVINLLFYIRNVAKLFKFCYEQNEFRDIPWVINTMGYTQGFGYDLMAAVFNVARPNLVVQIQSRKNKENFSRDMYAENVKRTRFALLEEYLNGINDLSYQLKIIRSVAGGGFGRFRMGAKDSRFCMILARLGTILKEQHDWLTDVRPYSVSYDDISIVSYSEHSVDDKESLLDIINANLVYLCKKEPGSEITECFGIGIVRGVDKAQKKVFVIASLEVETLRLVNTLAVCNIPIPTSLLLNQGPKVKGAIPYTYNTQNNAFTKHIYQYNSAHFFKAGQNNR